MANSTIQKIPAVIDNLTSTSTINALSANQGKALNDKIKSLFTVRTVNVYSPNAANTYGKTAAPAVSGYTPVGIVGFKSSGSTEIGINKFDLFYDSSDNMIKV